MRTSIAKHYCADFPNTTAAELRAFHERHYAKTIEQLKTPAL